MVYKYIVYRLGLAYLTSVYIYVLYILSGISPPPRWDKREGNGAERGRGGHEKGRGKSCRGKGEFVFDRIDSGKLSE